MSFNSGACKECFFLLYGLILQIYKENTVCRIFRVRHPSRLEKKKKPINQADGLMLKQMDTLTNPNIKVKHSSAE